MNRLPSIFLLCLFAGQLVAQRSEMPNPTILATSSEFAARVEQHRPHVLETNSEPESLTSFDCYPPVPLNLAAITAAIEYPTVAIEAGFEGRITAVVQVDEQGNYITHRWQNHPNIFLSQVIDPYLKSILFAPARNGECTVSGWTSVSFVFRLQVPRS